MKKGITIFLFLLFMFLLSACQDKTYHVTIVNPYDDMGTIRAPKEETFTEGEILYLEAIPFEGYEFLGWFLDDVLVSEDLIYHHEVEKGAYIMAQFDIKEHVLTLTSFTFYFAYDNPNNSLLKGAMYHLKSTLLEVGGHDLSPISIAFMDLEEESWIFVNNHEEVLVTNYIFDSPLVIDDLHSPNVICYFEQALGYHLQRVEGQHVSSSFASHTRIGFRFEVSENLQTIEIVIFDRDYVKVTMEVTYSYHIKLNPNI
jgi:hypothetical protein